LNIILNFILIVVLDLGVFGAAIGTVASQTLTSTLCLRKLIKMRDVFDMGLKYLWLKKKYVTQLLKLGAPTGASQMVFAIAMMITQPLVNSFGAMFIAVYVIVMRIDSIVMMPVFSFGNAMTVYTGQNVGAGNMDRVDQGVKQCLRIAISTSAVLVAVVLIFGRYIAGAFTQTQNVIDMTMLMLWILALGYIAFTATTVLWGVVRGAGDAVSPLWAAIINSVVIRLPSAYILVYLIGRPEALMYSLLASWLFSLMYAVVVYRQGRWRTKGLVKKDIIDITQD